MNILATNEYIYPHVFLLRLSTRGGWTRVTQIHVTPISSIEKLGPDFGLLPVQYDQTSIGPTQVFAMAVSLKLVQ